MSVELQLSAIRDLSPALAAASVDHWLIGGWAVDFACGRVSRPHKDVDLLTSS